MSAWHVRSPANAVAARGALEHEDGDEDAT
jgi:hypothetical protein